MWPWLPALLLGAGGVLVLVSCAIALLWARRYRLSGSKRIANTDVIFRLPEFRRATRNYRALLVLGGVLAIAALAVTSVAAARVITTHSVSPETRSRDIVLCLDVSGSMKSFDQDLLSRFDGLAQSFEGERVSLVLFDSSPLQVFPLTSDYDYAHEQIAAVQDSLRGSGEYSYRDGTRIGDGSSLVSDGLAGCVLQFDRVHEERSRTLVLASDYHSVGDPIFSNADAVALAKERRVTVHGFNPGNPGRSEAASFERDVTSTGGHYFAMRSDTDALKGVNDIVVAVTSDPATVTVESPVLTTDDQPGVLLFALAGLVAVLYSLLWRLRL